MANIACSHENKLYPVRSLGTQVLQRQPIPRDTPAVLRRWLDHFDPRFIGLTGTEIAIEAVQRAAGVPVTRKTRTSRRSYGVAHANYVLAYTQDNLAHVIYPGGVGKDDWVPTCRFSCKRLGHGAECHDDIPPEIRKNGGSILAMDVAARSKVDETL